MKVSSWYWIVHDRTLSGFDFSCMFVDNGERIFLFGGKMVLYCSVVWHLRRFFDGFCELSGVYNAIFRLVLVSIIRYGVMGTVFALSRE